MICGTEVIDELLTANGDLSHKLEEANADKVLFSNDSKAWVNRLDTVREHAIRGNVTIDGQHFNCSTELPKPCWGYPTPSGKFYPTTISNGALVQLPDPWFRIQVECNGLDTIWTLPYYLFLIRTTNEALARAMSDHQIRWGIQPNWIPNWTMNPKPPITHWDRMLIDCASEEVAQLVMNLPHSRLWNCAIQMRGACGYRSYNTQLLTLDFR